jgi:hypothetical protein
VTRVPAHPDWFGCLPHLLHSTTDLTWPAHVRANVDRSGSDPEGTTFVWDGPCVSRFSHTKWATFFRPLPGQMADLAVFCPAVRPATTTSRARSGEASRATPGPCWPSSPHRSCKPGCASRAGTAPTGGFGSGWVRPGPPGRSLHVNPDRRHLLGPPEPPRASEAGHQTRRGRGCGQVQPWSPLYIFFHMHNPHGP